MEKQKNKKAMDSQKASKNVSIRGNIYVGIYLIILAIILIYLFVAFWPQEAANITEPQPQGNDNSTWSGKVNILFIPEFNISYEVRMILLVILAGALGSYVHITTSFVDYVGNRNLKRSWLWWYILRPFSGSILAVIFYMIVRGGLISGQIEGSSLSHYGIAGIAGLFGLFSKQAIDKLNEIFNVLFAVKEKDETKRKDPLDGGNGEDTNSSTNKDEVLGSNNGEPNQMD